MIEMKEYDIKTVKKDTHGKCEPYGGYLCGVACENGMLCGLGCGHGVGGLCGTGCSK